MKITNLIPLKNQIEFTSDKNEKFYMKLYEFPISKLECGQTLDRVYEIVYEWTDKKRSIK